jgi:hypothetical protein
MKKLILFAILIVVLASCKKSSSGLPVNTITATINDTVYIFNQDVLDTTIYDNGNTGILLEAKDLNLNTTILQISTSNNVPLTPTTYGRYGDTLHLSTFGYISPASYSYGTVAPAPTNGLTIAVTTLTSTSIQGTFKGTIYFDTDTTSADKKTVTNGTFNFTKPIVTQ